MQKSHFTPYMTLSRIKRDNGTSVLQISEQSLPTAETIAHSAGLPLRVFLDIYNEHLLKTFGEFVDQKLENGSLNNAEIVRRLSGDNLKEIIDNNLSQRARHTLLRPEVINSKYVN